MDGGAAGLAPVAVRAGWKRLPRVCWWLQIEVVNRGKAAIADPRKLFAPYERAAHGTLAPSAALLRVGSSTGTEGFGGAGVTSPAAAAGSQRASAVTAAGAAAATPTAQSAVQPTAVPSTVESLGLGLPIARLFAMELEGRIGLFSRPVAPLVSAPAFSAPASASALVQAAAAAALEPALPSATTAVAAAAGEPPLEAAVQPEVASSSSGEHVTSFVLQVPLIRDFRCVRRSWQELVTQAAAHEARSQQMAAAERTAGGASDGAGPGVIDHALTHAASGKAAASIAAGNDAASGTSGSGVLRWPSRLFSRRQRVQQLAAPSQSGPQAAVGAPAREKMLQSAADAPRVDAAGAAGVPEAAAASVADDVTVLRIGGTSVLPVHEESLSSLPDSARARAGTTASASTVSVYEHRDDASGRSGSGRRLSLHFITQQGRRRPPGPPLVARVSPSPAVHATTDTPADQGQVRLQIAAPTPYTSTPPSGPSVDDSGGATATASSGVTNGAGSEGSGQGSFAGSGSGSRSGQAMLSDVSPASSVASAAALEPPQLLQAAAESPEHTLARATSAAAAAVTLVSAGDGASGVGPVSGVATPLQPHAPSPLSLPAGATAAVSLRDGNAVVPAVRQRPRVLVVDDEPVIRRIHARYLTRLGFEVTAVDDGDQCVPAVRAAATAAGGDATRADALSGFSGAAHVNVAAAGAGSGRTTVTAGAGGSAAAAHSSHDSARPSAVPLPFSAVLLDIVMRRVHGDQACRDLRAAGFTLPVIAATGNAGPRDVERLLGLGFDAVLEKPFSIAQLAAVLHSCGVDASDEFAREL